MAPDIDLATLDCRVIVPWHIYLSMISNIFSFCPVLTHLSSFVLSLSYVFLLKYLLILLNGAVRRFLENERADLTVDKGKYMLVQLCRN